MSDLFKLNWKDILNGGFMAFLAVILTAATTYFEGGEVNFELTLKGAIGAFVLYIIKRIISNEKGELLKKNDVKPTNEI